jgi:cobyrinic acid a,c-diamide synthase
VSGLILSAPSSGSGKTTITLGLLRALRRRGIAAMGAKSGPDYIDPRFHEAASGQPCFNLDAWAMSAPRILSLARHDGLLIVEGAMGLFDGAPPDGKGATADLARLLRLPVILIVDASSMAQSVAPLVAGFARHDPGVPVAGVILNRVGSLRHDKMLRRALLPLGIPILGSMPRVTTLSHPSRHLGLVQAEERPDLEAFLDTAADLVEAAIDIAALIDIASHASGTAERPETEQPAPSGPPPGQTIAIARDAAFAFAYPHLLEDWHRAGATVTTFSPLADDPVPPADVVILPGGYPELHAGRIAAADRFLTTLRAAAGQAQVYGECGGFMVLGDALTDAAGIRHPMAGLLRLETSFKARRLHLGYRNAVIERGPFKGRWTAHEFHYATTLRAEGDPLFGDVTDAEGLPVAETGLRLGQVSGSFLHLIDRR